MRERQMIKEILTINTPKTWLRNYRNYTLNYKYIFRFRLRSWIISLTATARIINCCSTHIQVFHKNEYVYMYTMQSYMHSECELWKSSIWPGQRSCTWPILQFDITPGLKYNFAKFHHSTSNWSWVRVKTDGRTDRQTDRHTRRSQKALSCGRLDKRTEHLAP